jgi:hypothetical protein
MLQYGFNFNLSKCCIRTTALPEEMNKIIKMEVQKLTFSTYSRTEKRTGSLFAVRDATPVASDWIPSFSLLAWLSFRVLHSDPTSLIYCNLIQSLNSSDYQDLFAAHVKHPNLWMLSLTRTLSSTQHLYVYNLSAMKYILVV